MNRKAESQRKQSDSDRRILASERSQLRHNDIDAVKSFEKNKNLEVSKRKVFNLLDKLGSKFSRNEQARILKETRKSEKPYSSKDIDNEINEKKISESNRKRKEKISDRQIKKSESKYRQAKAAGLKTIRKTKVGKVALRHKGKIGLGLAVASTGYAYKKNQEGKTVKGRIKKAYRKLKKEVN